MKIPVMLYVAITTLLLVIITIAVNLNTPLNWIFYLTCIGQMFVVIMVYKVLKDNYTTNKSFEDYYEDHPIREYDNYLKT
ncbi:hypothetical protein [Psychroserpens luteus]|uniref:Uncharacterized protein n=1 Tax=Psychroserpens luteus TaxID=1434066 RepID=A0ABW5ZVF7_9FLAO|nr:hypothetical protein [Psychroserpens luteus]